MVLDTSAILAILLAEPEAEAMVRAIASDDTRLIGAATLVEASAVMQAKKGSGGDVALGALLKRLSVETVPVTPQAAALARLAYGRFGKGVGSPGVLSFGDCLACGVALSLGEPLLFKGGDFSQTDVGVVTYR